MGNLGQDIVYGMRLLMRRPGLSAVATVCLGLGIGVTTMIFSVVNGALLRPFPYENPYQLVTIWGEAPDDARSASSKYISTPNILDCRESTQVFADMALIGGKAYTTRSLEGSETVRALGVTSNLLGLLGVRPALGQPFRPEHDQEGHQQVAILTHRCWKERFHGDPNVVGTSVVLRSFVPGDQSFTIIGVLPPQFVQPVHPMYEAEMLVPLDLTYSKAHRDYRLYKAVGRLKDGVHVERAQAELRVISRRLAQEYPKDNRGLQLFGEDLRAVFA